MSRAAAGVVLAASLACSSKPPPPPAPKSPPLRAQCRFGAGDLPAVTLDDHPEWLGDKMPLDTFVVVMQENRSFDSYYSSLTVPGQTVEVAPNDLTLPDPSDGGRVGRHHVSDYCFDNPAEEWADIHADYDGGAMDGFPVRNAANDPLNDPSGARALGYYDEGELPFYYALARAFSLSDRHFCSAMTNTWPNRIFFMAGSAWGRVNDSVIPTDAAPNLFTRLNVAKVDWKVYAESVPTPALLGQTYGANFSHFVGYGDFFADAAAGKLPPFVMVENSPLGKGVTPDEDPPAGPFLGQSRVERIVRAAMASPQWPHLALIFTYDEAGGFYDHVPPPPACVPDSMPPDLPAGQSGAYDQMGMRVPLIIVSPYAKRGHVSHVVTEHTSLTRLIAARFNLPAMTHRDANAEPPWDMFDFEHPDLSVPPLPDAGLDPAQLDACKLRYPPEM